MPREYDIVIPGPQDDPGRIDRLSGDLMRMVDKHVARNMRVMSWFSREGVPEEMALAVAEARSHLAEVFADAGLAVESVAVADPVFVNKLAMPFLEGAMRLAGAGGGYFGSVGVYDFFDRRPVVFMERDVNSTYTASVAFHEMYHAAARQVVAPIRGKPVAVRGGFWIDRPKGDPSAWFLEEGFVESESARYRSRLAAYQPFAAEADEFESIFGQYAEEGLVSGERIAFGDISVHRQYCSVADAGWFRGGEKDLRHSGLSSFAPESVDIILGGFGARSHDMLTLMRRARMDAHLVGDVARGIDAVWGKGTYRLMQSCPYDDWKAYDVLLDIRSRAERMGLPS